MRRRGVVLLVWSVAVCGLVAGLRVDPARATSAVFAGDPTDPATSRPYEILPGQPLVTAGTDGRLGTADDAIDGTIVGDVDLVVRLGDVPDSGAIPDPAAQRGALAAGVAGVRGVGVPIPFHVYLSDGNIGPGRPYGNLLAAADMDGVPVVVLLFADLDGDGVIGPSGRRPVRHVRALAELEPVGREVALFSSGVASGTIAVTAGGPANAQGVTVVATALAFTGPYDPNFLGGLVPAGPGIMTAQPFLPERDPARLFSQDIGPLEVGGTLNPAPRAAALPDPQSALALALAADGSSPTVDTARVVSGPAVCARLVERVKAGIGPEPDGFMLGTAGRAARVRLSVVAVDRLGNPSVATAPLAVQIVTEGPFVVQPNRDGAPNTETVRASSGRRAGVVVAATGPGAGAVSTTVGGVRCQRLALEALPERSLGGADVRVAVVGRADFRTIGAAVAGATDRDGDGRITVAVAPGIYRESVLVDRSVELYGAGPGQTVVDAQGLGPALALRHAGSRATALTASGGTVGISIEAPLAASGLEARGNIGAGIRVLAPGAVVGSCRSSENGGDGFSLEAAAQLSACLSEQNTAAGVAVRNATSASVDTTVSVANGGDGIEVVRAIDPALADNRCAGNLGTGLTLEETTGGVLMGNRAAANDGNGLRLNQSDGALVDRNDFSANGGYGMRIDRSTADFDAPPGVQAPPGSNDVSDNRKGPVIFD